MQNNLDFFSFIPTSGNIRIVNRFALTNLHLDRDYVDMQIENVLFLSSNPSNVEANAQMTLDFQRKKSYSGSSYTAEADISANIGPFSISKYTNQQNHVYQ